LLTDINFIGSLAAGNLIDSPGRPERRIINTPHLTYLAVHVQSAASVDRAIDRVAYPRRPSGEWLAKADPPKQRIIDLRVGDWLPFRDKVRKIKLIETFHDAYYAAAAPDNAPWGKGYEVIGSANVRPEDVSATKGRR
jgi:hypothetical protein